MWVPVIIEREADGAEYEECICPKCEETTVHHSGAPCKDYGCPKCGTKMELRGEHNKEIKEATAYNKHFYKLNPNNQEKIMDTYIKPKIRKDDTTTLRLHKSYREPKEINRETENLSQPTRNRIFPPYAKPKPQVAPITPRVLNVSKRSATTWEVPPAPRSNPRERTGSFAPGRIPSPEMPYGESVEIDAYIDKYLEFVRRNGI